MAAQEMMSGEMDASQQNHALIRASARADLAPVVGSGRGAPADEERLSPNDIFKREQFSVVRILENGDEAWTCRRVQFDEALCAFIGNAVEATVPRGKVSRVQLLNGSNACHIEWQHGQGVVYPSELRERLTATIHAIRTGATPRRRRPAVAR